MGTTGKQQQAPPPQPQQQQPATLDTRALRNDTFLASRTYLNQTIANKRSYFKSAFANPYNLSLFGGALAAATITFSPFLALIAVCMEVLWLLYAPESKTLRRVLWDPQFDKQQLAEAQAAREARLQYLDAADRARVETLVERQQEINQLAAQNPSFTGELLRTELGKTDRLVESFIDMAVTCSRYEQYLNSIDLSELERDRRRWESVIKGREKDDAETDIARKNLAIILKRFDKMREIEHYLRMARGQLDLIENSFQLIADQIVTMQSPQELTGQLDELLDGVESIKQTAADTEQLLNPLGLKDVIT